MPTPVSMCSNAFLMLGADPIQDFEEDSARALLAANLWPQVRDAVIRSHNWNCCIKRKVLAPEEAAAEFDYQFKFLKPSDWMRTLQVGLEGRPEKYNDEGPHILCDSNPLYLRFIFRNENVATWDSMLVHATSLLLKASFAYPVTKSTTVSEAALKEAIMFMRQTRAVDGQDDQPDTFGDFRLLASRRTSRI